MKWDKRLLKVRFAAEQGAIRKDWGGRLPVALVYANSYHIGMSNLGVQAVYLLLNNHNDYVCERVFYEPAENPLPLSMESTLPLTDFAVLAFSLSYELDYFNVPRILKAAAIPIFSKERNETYPIVIAGGACITANPLTLSPFFDCLCIGEAEAILPQMLPLLKEGASESRPYLLRQLAKLPGVFVPAYSATQAKRQWVKNLDDFPVHSTVLTHDTELGEMYLIEVERGCNWGCKFCMVSNCYKPMRFRSVESLLAQGRDGLKYRKKLGLLGPAVTDHPNIEEITSQLSAMGAEISVSSLRIKPLITSVLSDLIEGGARSLALAPEAGSQRLRDIIGKRISERDILEAVAKVTSEGISRLKLYFMIGLPTETDTDINDIVILVKKCRQVMEKYHSSSSLTLTVSAFIPKAGTPFQNIGMATPEVLNSRLTLLKRKLPHNNFSVKNESVEWSEVQAVLSRGDAKIADVLADMEKVSVTQWRKAMNSAELDIDYYAHDTWKPGHKLPWEI